MKTTLELVVEDDCAYERYSYQSHDMPRDDGPAAGTCVGTGNGIDIFHRGSDGV